MTDLGKNSSRFSLWHRIQRGFYTVNRQVLKRSEKYIPALLPHRDSVLVTALPKSGSTLLSKALIEATGYYPHFYGEEHCFEQDPTLAHLVDAWGLNTVTHQHMRALPKTVERLQTFRIKPVILVRDVFDALVSLKDHLSRESLENPTFTAAPEFLKQSDEAQLDALVDLAAPWYVSFVAGWQRAQIEQHWVTYEAMIADFEAILRDVLRFYGLKPTDQEITNAIAYALGGAETRLNVGRPGRGKEMMNDAQVTRIRALCRHFPDTDFSLVGIDK